jgi:predicted lipoprotein with Yx(FWY)xxD motif
MHEGCTAMISKLDDIAIGYGLDGRKIGVRVLIGQEFSPLHVAQTDSEAHAASYPMCTGGRFPRGAKRTGREADHSPLTSAEFKNRWIYTSTPLYVFVA